MRQEGNLKKKLSDKDIALVKLKQIQQFVNSNTSAIKLGEPYCYDETNGGVTCYSDIEFGKITGIDTDAVDIASLIIDTHDGGSIDNVVVTFDYDDDTYDDEVTYSNKEDLKSVATMITNTIKRMKHKSA